VARERRRRPGRARARPGAEVRATCPSPKRAGLAGVLLRGQHRARARIRRRGPLPEISPALEIGDTVDDSAADL